MSLTAKDIMQTELVTVRPEDRLLAAHQLLSEHKFSGLPVVDEKGRIQGIVTEYDLLSTDSALHLPTLQKMLLELPVYREDRKKFEKAIQELMQLRVEDVMNREPLTVESHTPFTKVLELFQRHHRVNPMPVVDEKQQVVGIISRSDILKGFDLVRKHEDSEDS